MALLSIGVLSWLLLFDPSSQSAQNVRGLGAGSVSVRASAQRTGRTFSKNASIAPSWAEFFNRIDPIETVVGTTKNENWIELR
jgi:hypothetical protein